MTKKKAFSGSTMTLKDFHGGSIPSDLPLPSAPGVAVKPTDRAGFDRHTPWGNSMGRSDHPLRPGSSPGARNFDDKTPFLAHTARIGLNFDEDERKPLDGSSAPRRTVSDESVSAPAVRVELKPESYSARLSEANNTGVSAGRPGSAPGVFYPSASGAGSHLGRGVEAGYAASLSQNLGGNGNSTISGPQPKAWTGRKEAVGSTEPVTRQTAMSPFTSASVATYMERPVGATHVGGLSQNVGGNGSLADSGSHQNAWVGRKELGGSAEPVPLAWSGPDSFSKLSHASALEKVSSGKWQTKQVIHHQADVEVMHHSLMEPGLQFNTKDTCTYNVMDGASGREHYDATLAMHVDQSLTIEDSFHCGGKEFLGYERARSPVQFEAKERNISLAYDGNQSSGADGRIGQSVLQPLASSESLERPKLKLLPRSKTTESSEPPHVVEYKQRAEIGHVEAAPRSHANAASTRQCLTDAENGNRVLERPRLTLKPRSQPLEQREETIEKKGDPLFGGARPREMVLKERGIDDVADDEHSPRQAPMRAKYEVLKAETYTGHATGARYVDKAEDPSLDHRIGRYTEKKGHREEFERADMQRRNWRNESWRNNCDAERQQQYVQERERSSDSWRRQPKPASPDASVGRFGKVASAAELAQAFSKSISDPKVADGVSGPRAPPGQSQIPFSRLVGQGSRHQINGY